MRERSRTMTRRAFLGVGAGGLAAVAVGGGGARWFLHRINQVGSYDPGSLARLRSGATSPLLERYPALARAVPWRPLGRFPTPLGELPLPDGAPPGRLLVKNDGPSSDLYGGNKVRKLEHLLAEAELASHTSLVTVGGLGTNHGLATTLHGGALGFAVELSLYEQPRTPAVERNLEALEEAGARIHPHGSDAAALLGARRILRAARARGESPYFMNVGGSSRLGNLGGLNAAMELADQLRTEGIEPPDRIFVAAGTSGTAAGLVAGLRVAGLPSRVCAVRVTGVIPANALLIRHFANDALGWLEGLDPDFPRVRVSLDDFEVWGEYRGEGYGSATPEAEEALRWAHPHLSLETTYTGKALAACLDYCRDEMEEGETVLFWNTYRAETRRVPGTSGGAEAAGWGDGAAGPGPD